MDPFYFDLQDVALVDDDYLTSLGDVILPPPAPAPAEGSAFAAYRRQGLLTTTMSRRGRRYDNSSGGGGASVHRRMFGYLRRIGDAAAAASSTGNAAAHRHAHPEPEAGPDDGVAAAAQAPRGGTPRFRHIMRERLRRERLSQGFADLHALLPPGVSKGGKNDIVGATVGYIRELERRKERLRNEEMQLLEQAAVTPSSSSGRGTVVVKVRAESEQHSVAVDVFEMVLRRLKAVEELRVTGIRSCFRDDGGMWMDVGVDCEQQISAGDVDKAITNALTEIEEYALRMQVPRSSKPTFSCHVERGVPM
ncbi:hypothetical protein EJB05_16777, partial [Eragrostis curvula]